MALQPLQNYYNMIDVPDAGKAFEEGMLWRRQEEARRAQVAEAEAIKRDIAALGPNPSIAAVTALTEKYPQISERYKPIIERMSSAEQKIRMEQSIPIAAALDSGNFAVAEKLMREQAEAARNSGDEEGAKKAEHMADFIKNSPDVAKPSILTTTAVLMNAVQPGSFAATFGKRKEEEKIQAETNKLNAETTLKKLEAQYAPDKIAAELGLTKAQTEQARAAAASSRAAAAKSNAEIAGINSALVPPEKRPELELKLRNEYASRTATYQDVKQAYGRVQASQPTAAGDLALIFNYMKMLDPGSAVREGEFSNAQNAAGVPDRIRNLYNKLINGERLNADQRKMFSAQAGALFNQAATGEKTIRTGLTRIATGYGLNPSNIFYEAVETPPAPPTGAAPPPAAVAPPARPSPGSGWGTARVIG